MEGGERKIREQGGKLGESLEGKVEDGEERMEGWKFRRGREITERPKKRVKENNDGEGIKQIKESEESYR